MQSNSLTADITEEEIQDAIGRLKANKSSGIDGFPTEWYRLFNREVTPLLMSSYNWMLQEGRPPSPSWREAIILPILKEGKDTELQTSVNPKFKLKIYTSILWRRFETLIRVPDIIDDDQSGFIKGHQTQDNIRRTLHIIDHVEKEGTKATMIGLDAEKAFDSVSW